MFPLQTVAVPEAAIRPLVHSQPWQSDTERRVLLQLWFLGVCSHRDRCFQTGSVSDTAVALGCRAKHAALNRRRWLASIRTLERLLAQSEHD